MGYEFNPQSQRFDVPNPHRVENLFLAVGAALLIASGFVSLFIARERITDPTQTGSWAALVAAIVTLFAGFTLVTWILWQLRFYFGREQPSSLSPEHDADANRRIARSPRRHGDAAAERLPLRRSRQRNRPTPLHRGCRISSSLRPRCSGSRERSSGTCWLSAQSSSAHSSPCSGSRSQASAGSCSCSIACSARGCSCAHFARTVGSTELSVPALIALAVAAVIGPVALGMLLPKDLASPLGMNWALLASLIVAGGLVATTLLLLAVLTQTLRPTTISMTNHLEVVSFNGAPNQIMVQFARTLQDLWFEKIPNRRYIAVPPQVVGQRGSFTGEVLEESQPVPTEGSSLTLSYALTAREYRFLIAVAGLALLLIAGASALSLMAVLKWLVGAANFVTGAGLCFLLALYCLKSSQLLWRRFRFTSRVYWLEMQGNFQESNVDFGNIVQDRFKSTKTVTNVEDMTLRLWVADVDSICYGRDRPRFVVGMAGNTAESQRLCQSLADFARSQAVVVSPTSSRDVDRASQIADMNRASALSASGGSPAPGTPGGPTIVPLPGAMPGSDTSSS